MALLVPQTAPGLPLGDINTTPLIDVMLVLLVMFVITIPVANHSLTMDLPRDGEPGLPILESNTLSTTPSGNPVWNGTEITRPQLRAILAVAASTRPQPELRFAPAATAPYGATLELLDEVKEAGVTAFGFVGNERYAEFTGPAPGKAAPDAN